MSIIKNTLIKIGTGFLYGIGFMIAVVIIGSLTFSYLKQEFEDKRQKSAGQAREIEKKLGSILIKYDESAKLSVQITKEVIEPNQFTLLGTISNNGDTSWSAISVKAELFNEAGTFIDECNAFINQASTPGSTINFKLSCDSCTKFQLRDYKSYKINIVNAFPK